MRAIDTFVANSLIHRHIQRFRDGLHFSVWIDNWRCCSLRLVGGMQSHRSAEQRHGERKGKFGSHSEELRDGWGVRPILLNFMAMSTHAADIYEDTRRFGANR